MSSFDFEGHITDIVDYPKPGVVFKDITTLLKDPDGFEATIDAIAEHFQGCGRDESRRRRGPRLHDRRTGGVSPACRLRARP